MCELALFAGNGLALGNEKIKAENAKLRLIIKNLAEKNETIIATVFLTFAASKYLHFEAYFLAP